MTSISNVTIVSDGTSQGTKVLVGNEQVKGITKIEFYPIECDSIVHAKITVNQVNLSLEPEKTEFDWIANLKKAVHKKILQNNMEIMQIIRNMDQL